MDIKINDRIKLTRMDDLDSLPIGTMGKVTNVQLVANDKIRILTVCWAMPYNTRTLKVALPMDEIEIIERKKHA